MKTRKTIDGAKTNSNIFELENPDTLITKIDNIVNKEHSFLVLNYKKIIKPNSSYAEDWKLVNEINDFFDEESFFIYFDFKKKNLFLCVKNYLSRVIDFKGIKFSPKKKEFNHFNNVSKVNIFIKTQMSLYFNELYDTNSNKSIFLDYDIKSSATSIDLLRVVFNIFEENNVLFISIDNSHKVFGINTKSKSKAKAKAKIIKKFENNINIVNINAITTNKLDARKSFKKIPFHIFPKKDTKDLKNAMTRLYFVKNSINYINDIFELNRIDKLSSKNLEFCKLDFEINNEIIFRTDSYDRFFLLLNNVKTILTLNQYLNFFNFIKKTYKEKFNVSIKNFYILKGLNDELMYEFDMKKSVSQNKIITRKALNILGDNIDMLLVLSEEIPDIKEKDTYAYIKDKNLIYKNGTIAMQNFILNPGNDFTDDKSLASFRSEYELLKTGVVKLKKSSNEKILQKRNALRTTLIELFLKFQLVKNYHIILDNPFFYVLDDTHDLELTLYKSIENDRDFVNEFNLTFTISNKGIKIDDSEKYIISSIQKKDLGERKLNQIYYKILINDEYQEISIDKSSIVNIGNTIDIKLNEMLDSNINNKSYQFDNILPGYLASTDDKKHLFKLIGNDDQQLFFIPHKAPIKSTIDKQRKILKFENHSKDTDFIQKILLNSFVYDLVSMKDNSQSTIFEKLFNLYYFN